MTATLEQTQADLLKLLGLVQQGEEVVITSQGRPVAKLTGLPQAGPTPNRQAWLAKLAQLRQQLSTGKAGPSIEQLLDEDRGN
jgi:prevent-host-death family protein